MFHTLVHPFSSLLTSLLPSLVTTRDPIAAPSCPIDVLSSLPFCMFQIPIMMVWLKFHGAIAIGWGFRIACTHEVNMRRRQEPVHRNRGAKKKVV
ncbi:hypothetical protein EV363DRAFT_1307301 [Boletus edulis]|nr:hypothetical protein EV363DRAFT_1307301 [Boletus edulis]